VPAIQEAFTNSTSWTVYHPWRTLHPAHVVVDNLGNTVLVAPEYGDGSVTVEFGSPLTGVMTLIGGEEAPTGTGPFTLPLSTTRASGPFANAVLVQIESAGEVDENGDQSDDGIVLWVGRAAGYLKRSDHTVVQGGQSIRLDTDLLYLRDVQGVPVVETPGASWRGSLVTIDDLRTGSAVRSKFRVYAMEHRAAGLPVDSLRLELDNEVVQ
jgi:hypothetical protein